MHLLIIGGTRFVGRHLVDAALAAGHQVTLFNRGQSAGPPPGVRWLQGDRRADLSALADAARDQAWDAVVDCCAYLPSEAQAMAAAVAPGLRGEAARYLLVSSVSAYASSAQPNAEDAPLGQIDDADTTVVDGRTYGPLKAFCEAAVRRVLGEARTLIVRPGLVVGPLDPTQRFTWWPARLARAVADGQPVLAPGRPQRGLQFIDARDLAAFMLTLLNRGAQGAFNAVAPPGFTTMAGLLQACADAAQPAEGSVTPRLQWCAEADLLAQGVKPWVDLPLWLPEAGEHAAFMRVPTGRAQAAGLQTRPLARTVADTLAGWRALPADQQAFTLAGLAPEREAALLDALAASGEAPAPGPGLRA